MSTLPASSRKDPLTIIGDGPLMDNLVQKAERLAINVNFMGAQPRNVVFDAMTKHRIFAMPSIRAANGDSEGLPIVLMEAQALGMAVVAFDEGPMREAIKPCHSGLLARARDPKDFAEQLHHLISSPVLCEVMGQAGRAHVEEQFNISSSIAELEDYYDEVMARSGVNA
ncbi:MAG: glycosyltransferase [Sphingobium sp.]